MIDSLSPAESLGLLLPYAEQHKNPKVRGKAGGAAAAAVARLDAAGVAAYGLPRLLQAASKLVTGASGGGCAGIDIAAARCKLNWKAGWGRSAAHPRAACRSRADALRPSGPAQTTRPTRATARSG